MIRIGICGFGYWGPNLLRVFSTNPAFRVVAIADFDPECQAKAREAAPGVRVHAAAEDVIDAPDIDAVAIASPVTSHYGLALRALKRGKHVIVEKPMCASADEGRELVAVAESAQRTLMVDHTYLFHGAVRKLKELKVNGTLGAITYYDS